MRIGLTYDLRDDYRALGFGEEAVAEFDSIDTIEAIESTLRSLGHTTERIGNVRSLAARLTRGRRWDLVFNIAEGVRGRNREAQVPALLEAFDQPYTFSDPLTCAATLDKAVAKRLVRDAGVPTAPFAVLRHASEAAALDLPLPVFLKPLAEGTGKGCEHASKVVRRNTLARVAAGLIARFDQPVIVEPFLPGREFTVGILGTGDGARIIAVCEISLRGEAEAGVYSLGNKEASEHLVSYALAADVEARVAGSVALAAFRALDCRDAARVDLRSDAAGRPQFLEVNPLPGLHPTHSDLPVLAAQAGMSYAHLIDAIVTGALARQATAPWRATA